MIIACDYDETEFPLIPNWLKLYNHDYHDNLKPEDITSWDISKFVVPECGQKIFEYIKYPKVFEMAEPMCGAVNAISYLKSKGHRCIHLTANNPDNVKDRQLKKHSLMEESKDLVVSQDKSLIKCDFLVDDYIDNLLNIDGIGILFTQPHNKDIDWSPRANDWIEVIDIIEGTHSHE